MASDTNGVAENGDFQLGCSNLKGQSTIEFASFTGEAFVGIFNPDGSAHTNPLYWVVDHRTSGKFFLRTEFVVALNDYDMECG